MRLLMSVAMIAMTSAACTAPQASDTEPDKAGIQQDRLAELDAASCEEIRVTMREAAAARADAAGNDEAGGSGPSAGQVARVVTMLVPIPGLGLLRSLATAAAKSAREKKAAETVDPETLYETARTTYDEKGCQPEVAAGDS